ncbi:hypothetical protein ACHHYP_06828 [Achlya hypogyna]|uniref:Uncharacterized protein n=1 Tax=Achlya hypogyna TaxID=1202772 RepID=A0A1V9YRJ9_ACHHY|nr:hypothetical protein ACHHYP_06828 [Achlya hypogyna]
MQAKVITFAEQLQLLRNLKSDLELATQSEDVPGGRIGLCDAKISNLLWCRDPNAYVALMKATDEEKAELMQTIARGVEGFILSIEALLRSEEEDVQGLPLTPHGLATMLPSTHTVESDFSVLKILKSDSRRSLSNYAMEGQMQVKQYASVKEPAASAKRAKELSRQARSEM